MKIGYRLEGNSNIGSWAVDTTGQQIRRENKDETNCDMCSSVLWTAPSGELYCDSMHTDKQVKQTQ